MRKLVRTLRTVEIHGNTEKHTESLEKAKKSVKYAHDVQSRLLPQIPTGRDLVDCDRGVRSEVVRAGRMVLTVNYAIRVITEKGHDASPAAPFAAAAGSRLPVVGWASKLGQHACRNRPRVPVAMPGNRRVTLNLRFAPTFIKLLQATEK